MIDRWSILNIISRYLTSDKLAKTKSTNSTNSKIKKLENGVLLSSISLNVSLMNDKITALSHMEVTALRTCTFSFNRKVQLNMMTIMKDSKI